MTDELRALGRSWGLRDEEMELFARRLGREPTRVELAVLSLNWSEHCSYKTSRPFLKRFPNRSPRTLLGPGENAGVVRINERLGVAFKIESHNHPSAVEPVHGAATGVGGILRDILAVGAWPLLLADSLRFGDPELPRTRELARGVVKGISFYGNATGVPTVAGEMFFHPNYNDNPLVNAMCVGVVRLDRIKQAVLKMPGSKILLFGSTTGRDGIHGATFASEDLAEAVEEKRPNVQIGDPFYEKLLIEVVQEILPLPGLIGLQDLGAGGLSTAPAEMAHKGGVGVHLFLDAVPLREPLSPEEILLSESQERMIACVEAEHVEAFLKVFRRWHLPHAVIGEVVEEPVFRASYKGKLVMDIPLPALMDPPIRTFPVVTLPKVERRAPSRAVTDLRGVLERLIQSPNLRSKAWVYERYDHTVQGNTLVPPGRAGAAVVALRYAGPHPEMEEVEDVHLAVTVDGNARWVALDPYEGGKAVVAEAARNIVAVGGDPIALTNGLNFANPEEPEVYAQLDAVTRGMAEAAEALGVPIVSGNVSLYNQSPRHRIDPTPIVGMIGLVPAGRVFLPQFRTPGDEIWVVGKVQGEVGGSEYLRVLYGDDAFTPDPVDLAFEVRLLQAVRALQDRGWVRSTDDVSLGGLMFALLRGAFESGLGLSYEGDMEERALFGEWQSRFVITLSPENREKVASFLEEQNLPWRKVGEVLDPFVLEVNGEHLPLDPLLRLYRTPPF